MMFKKRILPFIVLITSLLFSSNAFAQSEIRDVTADVMRGIKVGAGLSYITSDIPRNDLDLDVVEEGVTFSLSAGFLYELMVTGNFGLRPELLYVYQGGSITYAETGAFESKADVTLHYIQVPFLGTFHILPHFAFHIGPYIGFMLTGVSTVEIDEQYRDNPDYQRRSKIFPEYEGRDFENLDGGIAAGLEYNFNDMMIFGLRVNGSFQRLGDRSGYLADAKTYSARFYLGYTW